ncbi:alpha/beta hydrolase [Arthrobacter roseus]|uniref:alpha/beta hydrolase n=1 Tax=Arthrobacter roseus TaxID=136274 RepID=UPI0019664989|nr:alpha/beta hydrolase [Arthrobacter roseus]MBM7849005.1 alpha/beta superfamily hydrolase [Arthrobacter roseus]
MTTSPHDLEFSATDGSQPIRASSVLPANRENVELRTADGLTLVGEYAEPLTGSPDAVLLTLHPLPTHGGFMDSHVFRKASYRLPALANIAVLRFNTRGTCSPRGCSEGKFGDGVTEQHDLEAALAWCVERGLDNIWLVGWSFGTELCLKYGAVEPAASAAQGAVLLSPPLHRAGEKDLVAWAASGKPLTVLVPEFDDYLQPEEAVQRFSAVPQARVIGVDSAKHLWVGEKYARRALNEITDAVLDNGGASTPLPESWNGQLAEAPAPKV